MGIINNLKNSQKNKEKNKIKGQVKSAIKKAIMAALKTIFFILGKALIPLLIVVVALDWVIEMFTSENTPQEIYSYLEVEDIAELVEIKGNESDGYYLDFVDEFDEKLDDVVDKINKNAGYHTLPKNSTEFMKKLIKAEVYTQFPNLGGKIPEDEEDAFQGAVRLRRVTPNKEIGKMENTGKGETSHLEQETVDDPDEITDKNDANRINSWSEGEKLHPISKIPMYEELRETGYWEEKLDENGNTIYIQANEVVTYTGNYKLSTNAMTEKTTVYVEVKKEDGTQGYVKLKSIFAENENEEVIENTNTNQEIVKKWSSGKRLELVKDLETIGLKKGDIVVYTGDFEVQDDGKVYVSVKKGAEMAKILFENLKEVKDGDATKTRVATTTSRAKDNSNNKLIGKEGEEYVVAIAAGHNNTNNTGASSNGLVEQELTIQVAEKVEELLNEYSNIKVVQTGSTSDNPGGVQVSERTTLARNADPDLCIQIHFNAGGGTGVEAIYKKEDGISQQLAEILSDTISTSMGLTNRQAGPDTEKTKLKNLSIIESAAYSGFPSVVTEGGFLDNSNDANIIKNGGIEKYAEGIVKGIDEYFKADHSGYSATAIDDEKYTSSVESKIINMKYVSPDTLQKYIDEGNIDEALKSFTLDEDRKLVTVTWSVSGDGNVELKENASMNLKTALEKYIMPYEYMLYFYIDTNYEKFSEELADKVMESEIIVAVQDNVTTTETEDVTLQRKVSTNTELTEKDWKEVSSTKTKTETVNTNVNITYVSTWCVKAYQENSYSEAVIGLGEAEEKIVDVPGKVTETESTSLADMGVVEEGTDTVKNDEGENIDYKYSIYQQIETYTRTISNQYDKGDYKTEGKENLFVELYNKHKMKARVRTSGYLFSIIENNERTANLLNLTKYLIYKATGIPWGVLEYDYSEYSLESFNEISSGQIPLYTPVLSREDFIAAMEAYSYNSAYNTNFKANAALIYDESVKNGINPELVVITAQTEQQFRAGGGSYNYWGIAVYNGSSVGKNFSSLADGIAGYASVVKSYETDPSHAAIIRQRAEERQAAGCSPLGYGQPGTLSGMQSRYSSLGKHGWAYSSSGAGGYYYMDPAVAGVTAIYSTHAEFVEKCLNGGAEHADGTNVTIWEEGQYTAYQVQQKIDIWNKIFGNYGTLEGGNQQVIEIAKQYLGVPYVWGGTTPKGFDCSGFVQYVFAKVGISLPRTTSKYPAYIGTSKEVSKEEAQPGDIVWRSGHIGIYLGDDKYIHAPHRGDVVKISSGALKEFTNVFRFN